MEVSLTDGFVKHFSEEKQPQNIEWVGTVFQAKETAGA